MTAFEFRTAPHIIVKDGAAAEPGPTLDALGRPERVFIVTDAGVRAAGLLNAHVAGLEAARVKVEVYDKVVADPPEAMVLEAGEAAKAFDADAVIGFGGGSPMDTSKIVALLAGSDQPLSDMYGVNNAKGPRLPLALFPTTSGTGSEVTPIAIVTTGETTKMGVVAPTLYADVAVLDPELTVGLPSHVTAATGVDAMVHALEAYSTKLKKNQISDALALRALTLLHGAVEKACTDGSDRKARADMALGAMLAGQAFANAPCAGVHALAYPLGGIFHVPHGLSNALVLPHVLKFNTPDAAHLYAELGEHLLPGLSGSAEAKANAFIAELERICIAVKLERRLTQLGVNHNDLPRMAEDAMLQTRLLVNNPREITQDDALAIYQAAL
jgi:alcohol dehydrogenase